ncbi:MAG: adenylate/guanylate cyclase domain-containing protein [Hydrogenophilales bacterium]|nr:adenylate/guanylate cyclase domain-containing protein [Hydrogenophilales bacterium]
MGFALLLLLLGHVGGIYGLSLVQELEASLYDFKVRLFAPAQVDERVVIVDIDEKSLKEIGRWPWPRDRMAALTDGLFQQYGVAAVGYDIIFSEPDQSSGLPVLERLAQSTLAGETSFRETLERIRPKLDYDARLGEALAGGPSVLGYYFSYASKPEVVGQLPVAMFPCAELRHFGINPLKATGYNANLPRLQEKAASAAYFNMQADFDGVARRMPLAIDYQGQCYGPLALLTTQQAMGVARARAVAGTGWQPAGLDVDGLRIPLDNQAMAMVPYRKPGAFGYVSATDVVHGRIPASTLEGRAVLIGSSAPGIMDLRVTPISKVFPGVEIHANLISGILDGNIKWEPVNIGRVEIIALLAIGLPLAVSLPFLTPLWSAAATLAAALSVTGGVFYAWSAWNMQLPLAALMMVVLGLFVLNMSYGFFIEARSKAQITRLFGQYVPPELVDEMAKDPARYSLRGESKQMSVLFSDIVGFTTISEGLEASQLAAMLNVFLSHMTRLIQENRGTIDKYIGDAIMAFWGAPMSDERHARDAVLTGLAMQATLQELNPILVEHGWPEIRIGVGVNTGRMSVGNMGSEFRMAYTVMADAVNLASRLEALTRQYGVGVLVGEATREACPDIVFRLVDRVRVKGKDKSVAIYQPLGVAGEVAEPVLDEARDFEAVLKAYLDKNWADAEARLLALKSRDPGKLYDVYLERIGHFRDNPPAADWDGVYTYTSK